MKILMIESSPRKKSCSNLLASYFALGAEKSGNTVRVFDVSKIQISPCQACGTCEQTGPCLQRDSMANLRNQILDTDVLVFVTPIYYSGVSAQLKLAIDRFTAFYKDLRKRKLKTFLLAVAGHSNSATAMVEQFYLELCQEFHFQNFGTLCVAGLEDVFEMKRSPFPARAYEMGRGVVNPLN